MPINQKRLCVYVYKMPLPTKVVEMVRYSLCHFQNTHTPKIAIIWQTAPLNPHLCMTSTQNPKQNMPLHLRKLSIQPFAGNASSAEPKPLV